MHTAFAVWFFWSNLLTSETGYKHSKLSFWLSSVAGGFEDFEAILHSFVGTSVVEKSSLLETFPSQPALCYMSCATTQPTVCEPRQAGIECCFGGREIHEESSWSARLPSNSNTTSTLWKCAHPEKRSSSSEESVAVIHCVSPRQYVPASFLSLPAHTQGWSRSPPLGVWGISSGMWTAGRGGRQRAAKQWL